MGMRHRVDVEPAQRTQTGYCILHIGLAPLAAEEVMQALVELRDAGAAILLVEEHARNALEVADTLAFMELGTIVWSGSVAEADMQLLGATYLGGSVSASH